MVWQLTEVLFGFYQWVQLVLVGTNASLKIGPPPLAQGI